MQSKLAYPASFQALHANNEKQIHIQIEHNKINNPNWQEDTSWPFTSVAEHLNLGQPRVNSASGRSETQTWLWWIAGLMPPHCAKNCVMLTLTIMHRWHALLRKV